jgi:hypothetical protein
VQVDNPNQRLSLIPTLWSLVYRAHQGAAEVARSARQQLFERYRGAVCLPTPRNNILPSRKY